MRSYFEASGSEDLIVYPDTATASKVRIAFAVRATGTLTGRRSISNLNEIQLDLQKATKSRISVENMTFEYMDVKKTVNFMSKLHVFVSVHGAGMTNTFFMSPGSAVVEIMPYPLCSCKSPDYFYGLAGYYHGMSLALGIRHYIYCVPRNDMTWFADGKYLSFQDIRQINSNSGNGPVLNSKSIINHMGPNAKCSWKHLHAVDAVILNGPKFNAMVRLIERDFVSTGLFRLGEGATIVNINPHANG
jgi:hypothetical protein